MQMRFQPLEMIWNSWKKLESWNQERKKKIRKSKNLDNNQRLV